MEHTLRERRRPGTHRLLRGATLADRSGGRLRHRVSGALYSYQQEGHLYLHRQHISGGRYRTYAEERRHARQRRLPCAPYHDQRLELGRQQLLFEHAVHPGQPAPADHCRLLGQVGRPAGLHRPCIVAVWQRAGWRMGRACPDAAERHFAQQSRPGGRQRGLHPRPDRPSTPLQGGAPHSVVCIL